MSRSGLLQQSLKPPRKSVKSSGVWSMTIALIGMAFGVRLSRRRR